MSKETRDPSTVSWDRDATPGKRETDNIVVTDLGKWKFIRDWQKLNTPITVVSLTADSLYFVNLMSHMYKDLEWLIKPVESNEQMRQKLCKHVHEHAKRIAKDPRELYRIASNAICELPSSSQKLKAFFAEVQYDIIGMVDMDCMGTFGEDKKKTILEIFTNRALAERSALAVTIMGARGVPETYKKLDNALKLYPELEFDFGESVGIPVLFRARTEGVVKSVMAIGESVGIDVKPLRFMHYSGLSQRTEYRFLFDCRRR